MPIKLITDSGCDLSYSFLEENNIELIEITVTYDGKEFKDDLGKSISYKEFYDSMRNGAAPTTAQVNVLSFYNAFEKNYKEGNSVIYICLSSGLSGTHNNAVFAKNEILDKYKDADITIIDSKSASIGFALCIYLINQMIKEGKSKEEIVKFADENINRISHFYTVDDLNYLKRGGRISSTSAFVGSLLNIKPVLYVNSEGKLVPLFKVKGRKKAVHSLFEMMEKNIESLEEQTIFICHAECEEDAKQLKNLILEKYKPKEIITTMMGTTIGSHAGPGTLVISFLGKPREVVIQNSK